MTVSDRAAVMEDTLLPRDTSRSLPLALLRAREAVMVGFRPMLAVLDLTEQQWRVIRILAETSPLDATEVAERACVLAPSLTRIIKSLEERRIIRRGKDQGDGRRILLSLDEAGFDLIRAVTPQSRSIYAKLETRYGRAKMEHLIDMLNELATMKDPS